LFKAALPVIDVPKFPIVTSKVENDQTGFETDQETEKVVLALVNLLEIIGPVTVRLFE